MGIGITVLNVHVHACLSRANYNRLRASKRNNAIKNTRSVILNAGYVVWVLLYIITLLFLLCCFVFVMYYLMQCRERCNFQTYVLRCGFVPAGE